MELEDRVLGFSVGIEISLRTVKCYLGGRDGTLFLNPLNKTDPKCPQLCPLGNSKEAQEFGRKLKEGDKILLMRTGEKVTAVYGPVTEEYMYIAPYKIS